jgi:hypothetical protein
MADKQKWLNMLLPFIAGFAGGIVAILIFNPGTLFAEKQTTKQTTKQSSKQTTKSTAKQPEIPKILTAEEFRLVDKNGNTRATLSSTYTKDALSGKEYMDVQLRLTGVKGEVQLTAGDYSSGISMSQNDNTKDEKLHSSIQLSATGASSSIKLNYDKPVPKEPDPNNPVQETTGTDTRIELSASSSSQTSNIRLYDNDNNERINIGNAYYTKKDGTGSKCSTSSIHLYRDDGKVLWYERN